LDFMFDQDNLLGDSHVPILGMCQLYFV
jgi:hypothetical protein